MKSAKRVRKINGRHDYKMKNATNRVDNVRLEGNISDGTISESCHQVADGLLAYQILYLQSNGVSRLGVSD
jgi:hypothetical protein